MRWLDSINYLVEMSLSKLQELMDREAWCAAVHEVAKVRQDRATVRTELTPWSVAYQTPLSMEFSRQECRSGLPFPSLGDLPDPGVKLGSPVLQADSSLTEPPGKPQF